MTEYDAATYGEHVAAVYDDWHGDLEPQLEARVLAELAAGGRALELGIGTGRVAIPLAALGVEVHGIDSSAAMIERLRAKPGGEAITTTLGDMADVAVDGTFPLIFVVFNTFFMLTSQAEQVRCFRNVAAHLEPGGGRFVLRAFVPDTSRIDRGSDVTVQEAGVDSVRLDASVYDADAQMVRTTQVHITQSEGVKFVHARLRFAAPPELDLMAQLAGLELESRWGSFAREPFTADSGFHVSVYRRP
jgi:SAM-dependent methyltransferase